MHLLGDPTGLQTRRFQWGFIRRIGGYIPVNNRERSGPTLYHHVDRRLRRGGVVVLFPGVGLASRRRSPNIAILAARDFCATG